MFTVANITITKLEDLKQVSTADLVKKYNELTGKTTKKFASRSKGEEQVWVALNKGGAKQAVAPKVVAPKQAPSATPKKLAKSTSGDRKRLDLEQKIEVVSEGNPYREGSDVFDRWNKAQIRSGLTVRTAVEKGFRRGDLRWSIFKGYIKLVAA